MERRRSCGGAEEVREHPGRAPPISLKMAGITPASPCGNPRLKTYIWFEIAPIATNRNVQEFPIPVLCSGRDRHDDFGMTEGGINSLSAARTSSGAGVLDPLEDPAAHPGRTEEERGHDGTDVHRS